MDLDKFIENNTPKKKISIFDEYVEDINKLLELNYSQKQVIEYLKTKCKNKTGLTESNLSRYLKKPKKQNVKEVKNIDIDKSKNSIKDKIEKKPIDIFANLKTKDSKTPLEQNLLDFVKELK
jgi:type II secretory pathway component PulL